MPHLASIKQSTGLPEDVFRSFNVTCWQSEETVGSQDIEDVAVISMSPLGTLVVSPEVSQTTWKEIGTAAVRAPEFKIDFPIESPVREENGRALALLDAWLSEPDDLGEDWWEEFEQEMYKHRLTIQGPEE